MNEQRSLGAGALAASLAQAAAFGLYGLSAIAIARILGPEGSGALALAHQFLLVGLLVAGLGLRTAVGYRVGAGLWSVRTAVRFSLAACGALGLAGAALGLGFHALLAGSAFDRIDTAMAVALMAALPLTLAWWILPAIAVASERYEAYALLWIVAPLLTLLLSPALAAAYGITAAVIGYAAAQAVSGLVVIAWALRFAAAQPPAASGEKDGRGVVAATAFGLRAWVNDLFQVILLRPDLFILNAYAGLYETGIYSVAVTITAVGWTLTQALGTVMLPGAARMEAAAVDDRGTEISRAAAASAVRHSVLVSAFTCLALAAVLAAVPLIWGPEFRDSVELGLIMLPGVFLLGVGRVMVAVFTGRGHSGYALAIGVLSLPATVLAYLLVIPDHGATGAAIVSCASYVAVTLLAVLLFFRSTGIEPRLALVPGRRDLADYVSLGSAVLGRLR